MPPPMPPPVKPELDWLPYVLESTAVQLVCIQLLRVEERSDASSGPACNSALTETARGAGVIARGEAVGGIE